jgi:hypothetical protein
MKIAFSTIKFCIVDKRRTWHYLSYHPLRRWGVQKKEALKHSPKALHTICECEETNTVEKVDKLVATAEDYRQPVVARGLAEERTWHEDFEEGNRETMITALRT